MNPYESPAADSPVGAATPPGLETAKFHQIFRWALFLVAAGAGAVSLWLWGMMAFLGVGTSVSTNSAFAALGWLDLVRNVAGWLLTMGYLLSVYVPKHYRVARYAVMAAVIQLALFAGVHERFPKSISWTLRDLLEANIPSLIVYGCFLFLLQRRCREWRGGAPIRRGTLAVALCCGVWAFVAFAATAGDAIATRVDPGLFVDLTGKLAIGVACAYYAMQLLAARNDLEGLTTEPSAAAKQIPR